MFYKRRRVKVEVDGIVYNSMQEAADALGCNPWNISDAFKTGTCQWHGHKLKRFDGKYADVIESKNKMGDKKPGRKGCKIVCTTTGEMFDSIARVAENCDTTSWYIGLNLAKNGRYTDKKGNIYIKQADMNNTSKISETIKQRIEAKNKVNTLSNTTSNFVSSKSTTINKLSELDAAALRNVTINMVQNKNYNEATVLLNILRNNI